MLKHKTNPELVATIQTLRRAGWKNESPLWRLVAKSLEKPSRTWATVNVGHIARVAAQAQLVVVPGKVLGAGELAQKVDVAAWGFSDSAREKIHAVGGRCLSLSEAASANPSGTGAMVVRQ